MKLRYPKSMELTRRSFLRGALTLAVVSVAPPSLVNLGLPRIVGDGVHDDTLGLQTALDGDPFICEGDMVIGGERVAITGGRFLLSRGLTIRRDDTFITNAHFNCTGVHEPAFLLNGGKSVFISNCFISTDTVAFS